MARRRVGVKPPREVVSVTDPTTESVLEVNIYDDGSSTGSWVDRLKVQFKAVADAALHPTFWLNEYGEFRGIPAKSNTVAGRFFAAKDATDLAARSATTPVFEVTDQRDGTRTTIFAVYHDGSMRIAGRKLTIGPTAPGSSSSGDLHILTTT